MADPISHVNVVPVGEELLVTWRGGSENVSVFVSHNPDDAGIDVCGPDRPGTFSFRRTERRQYIHLFDPDDGFTVAADRQVVMDGPDNFRDLGGYAVVDGRHSRWGRVFRSDRLDGMSEHDRARLQELGIGVVFDLRSQAEVEFAPDELPPGVDYVHLPMSSDVAEHRSMTARIRSGELDSVDQPTMADGYLQMLEGFGDHIAAVVDSVASGERVLFHCTAGKDRTGVMAMVLLGLVGVADPYLLDDYEISSRYRTPPDPEDLGQWFPGLDIDPRSFSPMFGSERPVMKLTIDGLRERWGDHLSYARSIGVGAATVESVRRNLRVDD